MTAAVVFLAPVVAGLIQAVTGFGSGIFMMVFFPMLFPILGASAISSAISLAGTCTLSWHYRKKIQWKLTLIPAIVYILVSSGAIILAPYLPTDILKKVFGVFLMLLSVYFLVFSSKLKIKATLLSATICGSLAGVLGGLFGIGGPPMVIFFLAALDDKEEYLGTIQFHFFITGLYMLAFRIYQGIFTMDMIPYTLLGMVGMMIGKKLGTKVVDRINADTMKKLVYAFLGVSGFLNLL